MEALIKELTGRFNELHPRYRKHDLVEIFHSNVTFLKYHNWNVPMANLRLSIHAQINNPKDMSEVDTLIDQIVKTSPTSYLDEGQQLKLAIDLIGAGHEGFDENEIEDFRQLYTVLSC